MPAELWVHGGPNGHERLWSTTGVRQGDPLGPLLLSLGMQDVLGTLEGEHPDVKTLSYRLKKEAEQRLRVQNQLSIGSA